MAAPTQPTLITICTEALNRAGYSSPDSTLLTRAEDHFMEKVKHDIWKKAKKLKSLQTTRTYAITEGLGLIDLDSDFSSFLSMQLLSCTHFGVCQAGGSTTTAILASDEDMDSDYPIGKELVIYLTATKTTAYS